MRCDPAKRYNARGERFCLGCQRYLAPSSFEQWRNGKIESRCRVCRRTQSAAARNRRLLDAANWQRQLEQSRACKQRQRQRKQEERRAFVVAAIERMRQQGFTLAEIGELADVRRDTLSAILAGRPSYIWTATEARLFAVWRATTDLPLTGRPTCSKYRKPHPALGLVRARLDRMAYLAELEAA